MFNALRSQLRPEIDKTSPEYRSFMKTLEELERRGFIERDHDREMLRLHPRWADAPKAVVLEALELSEQEAPFPE